MYIVSHPDLIKELLVTQDGAFMKGRALQEARRIVGNGLLTSEGEQHLHQRRLIQPLFAHERIEGYGSVMVDYAARAAARWHAGETIDVGAEMTRLTLAVVGKTLFDADIEGDAHEVGEALTTALELLERFMTPWARVTERLPLPAARRLRAAQGRLDAMIERLIEERRDDLAGRTDLLSLLLQARDERGEAMPLRQVRDEAMTIVLAGHETTAQGLTWTWYLLSQNPDAEARVHEELAACSRRSGCDRRRSHSADGHPGCGRRVDAHLPAGVGDGAACSARRRARWYTVPKGAIVGASQLVVHRDPRWWPEPERFDLDRWTEAAAGSPSTLRVLPVRRRRRGCASASASPGWRRR